MLDRLAALTHRVRVGIEPLLHGFEQLLMLPPGNSSLRSGRAFRFQRAGRAHCRPVASQLLALLLVRVSVRKALAGRTTIDVLIGQIDEVLLAEPTRRLRARCHRLGNVTVMPASWHSRISGLLK